MQTHSVEILNDNKSEGTYKEAVLTESFTFLQSLAKEIMV